MPSMAREMFTTKGYENIMAVIFAAKKKNNNNNQVVEVNH
jgi:hypothetical protein